MSNHEITSIHKNIIRKIRYFILFKFLMYILYKKYLLRKRKVFHNKNKKKTYLINYLYSKVFLTLKEKNLKSIMEINHCFNYTKIIVKQIKNIK